VGRPIHYPGPVSLGTGAVLVLPSRSATYAYPRDSD